MTCCSGRCIRNASKDSRRFHGPFEQIGVFHGPFEQIGVFHGPFEQIGVFHGPFEQIGVFHGPLEQIGVSLDDEYEAGGRHRPLVDIASRRSSAHPVGKRSFP